MLPKPSRLNLKIDFKWVAAGRKLETKYVRLFIREGENTSPRIGIAASGKFFKKAHERNRARRLVAAAFHNTYYLLPNTINIVALPKSSILSVKSQDVLLDLEKALTNEKLIN